MGTILSGDCLDTVEAAGYPRRPPFFLGQSAVKFTYMSNEFYKQGLCWILSIKFQEYLGSFQDQN